VAVAVLAVVVVLLAPAAGRAAAAVGWGSPFRLAGPAALDLVPADLAFSPAGGTAIGFGIEDEDNPPNSQAFTALRAPRGAVAGQRRVPGAQAVLDLAYDGPSLVALAGTSPPGLSCCSSAEVIRGLPGRRFGPARTVIGGLAGATQGRLVMLGGRVLAAVATERGVWVAQSSPAGRFGPARRLSADGALPQALAATSLPGGQSVVAWTALPGPSDSGGPQSITVARGSLQHAPQGHAVVLSVPTGHAIDELALASGAAVATVAWIESWFDSGGGYHSQLWFADLRRAVRAQAISAPGELASGLSFGADARGDQAIAWSACTIDGSCLARGALRPSGRRFAAPRTLGAIDAGQNPAVALAPTGQALTGWLDQGHVMAAAAARGATRPGPAHVVSRTGFAADLTLGFGPIGQALAVWTQGTLAQTLTGAVYRLR
jgi:hypothetical protein